MTSMMTQMAWILLVFTSLVVGNYVYRSGWMNKADQKGFAICNNMFFFISKMSSFYDHYHDYRRFKMECRELPISAIPYPTCRWSVINTNVKEMDYTCPDMGWLTSLRTNNKSRFDMLFCCNSSGYITNDCESSGYVNGWQARFAYTVPSGRIMVGMKSKHDDDYEDSRYQFETCKMVKP